jgi:hypothetical protein
MKHRHIGKYRTRKGVVRRRPVHKHNFILRKRLGFDDMPGLSEVGITDKGVVAIKGRAYAKDFKKSAEQYLKEASPVRQKVIDKVGHKYELSEDNRGRPTGVRRIW